MVSLVCDVLQLQSDDMVSLMYDVLQLQEDNMVSLVCNVLQLFFFFLFADDGTLNTANDNIDNIRRDLHIYDVYMMSLDGVVEIGWH